jgi:hypothetical protein
VKHTYETDQTLLSYDQQLPDPPRDAPLWRFMPLNYLRKQFNLRRYDVADEITLIHHQGSNRLFTEMYFLSCWNLYNKEHEMQMWQQYAKCGVAVQTTFGRLQSRTAPDGP